MRKTWILIGSSVVVTALYGKEEPLKDPSSDRFQQNPTYVVEESPTKSLSLDEKKKLALLYEGKYLGYEGEVYRIKKDGFYEVMGGDEIYRITSQGIPIISVEKDIFQAFSEAKTMEKLPSPKRESRVFQNSYITSQSASMEIYWVGPCPQYDACQKQKIPDRETLEFHRAKTGRTAQPLVALTEEEFQSIKDAPPMGSVLTEEYKTLYTDGQEPQVLPIEEACRGLVGQYGVFLSQIYWFMPGNKLGTCTKKIIEGEDYLKKFPTYDKAPRLVELTPSQMVTIPDSGTL